MLDETRLSSLVPGSTLSWSDQVSDAVDRIGKKVGPGVTGHRYH